MIWRYLGKAENKNRSKPDQNKCKILLKAVFILILGWACSVSTQHQIKYNYPLFNAVSISGINKG